MMNMQIIRTQIMQFGRIKKNHPDQITVQTISINTFN
jgi:hypothetical protein